MLVKMISSLEGKMFQYIVTEFSLTWSLFNDNLGFRIMSVGLRDVAEFRDYPLVAALSVFYKPML
jgi:hypothetical protein